MVRVTRWGSRRLWHHAQHDMTFVTLGTPHGRHNGHGRASDGGGLGTTSRVGPTRPNADVCRDRDTGEIGLPGFFHHRLQPVSDLSSTLVWCFEEDFVMDGANDDGS